MSTSTKHTTEEKLLIHAPIDVVRELVLDVESWPQLHPAAIHAEYLERTAESELIQHWSLVDDHTVRTWRARRWSEDDGARIVFRHEPVAAPFAMMGGGFTFEPREDDSTLVHMHHEFALLKEDDALAAGRLEAMSRGSGVYLETLRYAAENREELSQSIISFVDPLFIAGAIEDAYQYLYEADKWPERIPHVKALTLEEPAPGIQFFDMDTVSGDGAAHTTRSVRICLPHHKIVYKQIKTPPMLAAHTGHWEFVRTPEGVESRARHTATIIPDRTHLLGEGTTVQGARNYLRRVLGTNSLGNLRLAKEYAETRAGF
ncbi:aromatase/cyclase [Amycolatopsis sp. NBC_00345]|uniref:aromatase/cyclase n=1 Tax=Amycolatopsis sp. NBC_00345 TaxID=2975955 RepID=UPI002E25F33D